MAIINTWNVTLLCVTITGVTFHTAMEVVAPNEKEAYRAAIDIAMKAGVDLIPDIPPKPIRTRIVYALPLSVSRANRITGATSIPEFRRQ